MPARLAIEPTLRSKSPITMTMVMPAATTISIESCWVMLSQLRAVMKVSGRLIQKKTRISSEADQRAVAAEDVEHQAACDVARP